MSAQEDATPTNAELRALDADIARRMFGLNPQKRWTQTSDNGESLYLIPAGGRIERHGVLYENSHVAPRIHDGPVHDRYDEKTGIRTISPAGTVRQLDIYIYRNQHGEEDFEPLEDLSEEWAFVDNDDPNEGELVPRYSKDIAGAWQVVEKMIQREARLGIITGIDGYRVSFFDVRWGGAGDDAGQSRPCSVGEAVARTAPEAICRAALAATRFER